MLWGPRVRDAIPAQGSSAEGVCKATEPGLLWQVGSVAQADKMALDLRKEDSHAAWSSQGGPLARRSRSWAQKGRT